MVSQKVGVFASQSFDWFALGTNDNKCAKAQRNAATAHYLLIGSVCGFSRVQEHLFLRSKVRTCGGLTPGEDFRGVLNPVRLVQ